MRIRTINPATGDLFEEYPSHTDREVDEIVRRAEAAFGSWRRLSFADRAQPMRRAADILRQRKQEIGELMAREMGKPVTQGIAEAEKCAWVCEYYADHAEEFLASQAVETDASTSYVAFRPLGIVLAIMPWNYPFWQVFRFAAPGLMAGNAGLLKHAPNVTGCAMAIEKIFTDAGFPAGLFSALRFTAEETGRRTAQLIANPTIRAVTLTGSVRAGKAVAAAAGAHLKKTVLELGGSDPYVVLEDADLTEAVATCVTSRLLNSGQSCIAAKRFVVVDAVRDRFVRMLVEEMGTKKMGDPFAADTDLGPQARLDLRENLHRQVTESVAEGATLLLGGKLPDGPGAFYPPTVLAEVKPGMPAYEEELFGPVAAVLSAKDTADAVRIANDTSFGLGAAVFTSDVQAGERIAAEELEAGCCFVNAFVKSDPRLPFGGIRASGYGRELGVFGIREFVNVKTVYVR
ncbi:MAG TPA: NAD-dependent succinate-semialdehyde dehydrogenase [Gemmatimonadales bacterium]|nr:NAD-dependent succinate-semialdehyde dehydrogenase [Gemmatimonadales bacterium]